jgi:hypothetical protein
MANLSIALHYQTLPSRWMEDLFSNEDVPLVAQFKSMYEGYNRHNEIINEVQIDNIDLGTTSITPILSVSAFSISPNPISGAMLQINLATPFANVTGLRYQIIDLNGRRLQDGAMRENIELNPGIASGVYYFALYEGDRLLSIKPFAFL